MKIDEFLRLFFSTPNLIEYDEVLNSTKTAYSFLRENIALLNNGKDPQFTFLPYQEKKEDPTRWCGLAFSSEQKREMRMFVDSFIGRTYADLDKLDIKDSNNLGKAIHKFTNGYAIKFSGDYREVKAAIILMNNLRKKKPHINIRKHSSTGNLIRSFYFAIEAKDKNEASRLYDVITKRKFLDATNLLFLDVHLKAEFEEWAQIYQHQHYTDLLSIRRPKLISQSLLQAIYYQRILPEYSKSPEASSILKYFKEEIYPQQTALFQQDFLTEKTEILLLRMMQYLISDVKDRSLIERIVAKADELKVKDELWQKLFIFHTSSNESFKTIKISSEEAHQLMIDAFKKDNFEGVKFYASQSANSDVKASILLNCAIKLKDTECFNQFLVTNSSLPDEKQTVLGTKVKKFISQISDNIWIEEKTTLPENWVELIEIINQDDVFAKKSAQKFVEKYSLEWSSKDLRTIDNYSDRLVKALETSRSDIGENILKKILPKLISFLWEEEAPSEDLRNVYYTLFTILAVTEDLHRGELITINELVLNILKLGVSCDEYHEILSSINDQYQYYESPNTIGCAIDLIDIILLFPIADKNAVITLLSKVKVSLDSIIKIADVHEQIQLFNSFCDYLNIIEYKFSEDTTDRSAINPWKYYQNKSIAIYTLTEGAAKRAEAFIVKSGAKWLFRTFGERGMD